MAERESAGVGKQCAKPGASLGFVHTCPILRERQRHRETGKALVAQACHPSIWETEAG